MKKIYVLIVITLFSINCFAQIFEEAFADGDFTATPAWAGNTSDWQIINSDVAAGSTSSNTLRLNYTTAAAGTKYLSTQRTSSWGTEQSWGFWMGRRAQAATAANQSIIWLYANESDVTSATVDGYRIKFGDDSGGDDIVLERVDNGVATAIITSTGSVTNSITDYGFQVRVTRSSSSGWTVFTSTLPSANGTGAIATDNLFASTTSTSQGTATDATYTDFSNGYFAFVAIHSSGANGRAGAEFDNLKFDTDASSTLPIKLIYFNAKKLSDKVQLNWSTASELNNSVFDIERSVDGKEFVSIGEVEGAGNSQQVLNYSFMDEEPVKGTSYYQLRQTDFDGTSTVSKIVAVEMEGKNFEIIHVNPKDNTLNMEIYSPASTQTEIIVIDLTGKIIAKETITLSEGYNSTSVSTRNLSPGIHLVKISSDSNSTSKKFIF